jgi:hypothetical protein
MAVASGGVVDDVDQLVRWTIRERRRGHWGIPNGTLGFVRRMMRARDTSRLRRWGGRRGGGRSVWGRRWRVCYVVECRSRRPAQDDVGARGRWPACIVDRRCEERALRRPRRCVCCGISWIMDWRTSTSNFGCRTVRGGRGRRFRRRMIWTRGAPLQCRWPRRATLLTWPSPLCMLFMGWGGMHGRIS